MAKLLWDQTGEHFFETGIDHGILFPMVNNAYPQGYAWNGLTGVTETPEGAEANAKYADNIKYLNLYSAETFKATVKCFTYPDEFGPCNGEATVGGLTIGQQTRQAFGLAYRTIKGNDTLGNDLGYKWHLIYNCHATPSERDYQTVNDSPDAIEFSYEIETTPVALTSEISEGKTYKPTSLLVIDSTTADPEALATLNAALEGTDGTPGTDSYLPLPDAVITMFAGD